MKIATVCGTRPNIIKVAALTNELRKTHTEVIIETGQHYDNNLSKDFYKYLNIQEPEYNLSIGSGSHSKQTASILIELENILVWEDPDFVIVYGDTNSTLGGAICASKMNIPVVHIESGVRSYDRSTPEELNRIIVDHVSSICCCPTESAVLNLESEGVHDGYGYYVINTGDVMYDSVLKWQSVAIKNSDIIASLGLTEKEFYLATIHRAENSDDRNNLEDIITNLGKLKKPVVFPIHPRTRKFMSVYGIPVPKNILLIDPVNYFDILALITFSDRVITDSGGLQKEAYFIGTPCITLRKTTEWKETIDGFWNICVGYNFNHIVSGVDVVPNKERRNIDLFGDGFASKKIVGAIEFYNVIMDDW
jgi:UDP-GlcNAc3NAcA epimerase